MAAADSLTAVAGLKVGHWTDSNAVTGCTVVLCEEGAVAGADIRGGAPGTRETDLLSPGNLVERVHAVLLTGGSAFGLDATGGVMRWLEEKGVGYATPAGPVPIVVGAVLYDLNVRIFRRTDLPCFDCGTTVQRVKVGGRSTHFCPTCQK